MEIRKVFVSYSWQDRNQVNNIISELKANNYNVPSFDSCNSYNIGDTISELIISSDVVIGFYSENYSTSKNAFMELTLAIANHKTVILVVVGDVLLPFYLQSIQYIKVKDFNDASRATLDALSKYRNGLWEMPKATAKKYDNLEEVIASLKKALEENQLTLVCGAGVSIPSGIPVWKDLLISMIDNEMFDGKHSLNPYDNSAEELISLMTQSSIILGKYLKLISGKNFETNVRKALYESIDMFDDYSGSYTDTMLMDAITELARPKRRGKQLESIITFNFDDIIETKLQRSNIDYCSVWKEGQNHDVNAIPIYHVHGFLPRYGALDDPNLVFSEEAYHSQFIDPYSWSNLLQLNTFSNNVCLFVGISLSDPNLRRLLDISWRRNQRKKHYIVMKRTLPEGVTEENREKKEKINLWIK